MKAQKIVTFGEQLLRFSKPGQLRLTQGDMFTSKYGGSEANVAVSLAVQGEDVTYVTRLPNTPVGHAGAQCMAQMGVDISRIVYGGQRIGTYYFEPAAGMRAAKVVYDRDHSAYYDLAPGMIDWRSILKGADIFQVSGITAAISQQAADATFEALDIAEEMGITISFDINYRKNLWKYGADPRKTLQRMLSRCDMMFGDAIEFEWISQHPQPPFTATDSNFKMQIPEYREWFDELHAQYPRCRQWLMGMRNIVDSNHHTLTALLFTDGQLLEAPIIDIPDVVDPVGVGDAFMGGFLHAISLFPGDRVKQLNYSLAAASLKNTIPGDFNLSTEEEILATMEHRYNATTLYKTIE
ncbi:MAG: sugar kinase [Prevotella sp.]|nr:sugar kinase [Prevotella sp.]